MGTLEYSSNNSGGSWWLSDGDWKALENAGWKVNWFKDSEYRKGWGLEKGSRWLGALASSASLETDDFEEGVSQWESITGQNATDQGCNCCGQPHYFSFEGDNGESRSYQTYTTSYGSWS